MNWVRYTAWAGPLLLALGCADGAGNSVGPQQGTDDQAFGARPASVSPAFGTPATNTSPAFGGAKGVALVPTANVVEGRGRVSGSGNQGAGDAGRSNTPFDPSVDTSVKVLCYPYESCGPEAESLQICVDVPTGQTYYLLGDKRFACASTNDCSVAESQAQAACDAR